MQLNQAKFRLNGACGYVLKPEYMTNKTEISDITKMEEKLVVSICVIAGRHVGRPGRYGISNPFVCVEVYGTANDLGTKLSTRAIRMFNFVFFYFNII